MCIITVVYSRVLAVFLCSGSPKQQGPIGQEWWYCAKLHLNGMRGHTSSWGLEFALVATFVLIKFIIQWDNFSMKISGTKENSPLGNNGSCESNSEQWEWAGLRSWWMSGSSETSESASEAQAMLFRLCSDLWLILLDVVWVRRREESRRAQRPACTELGSGANVDYTRRASGAHRLGWEGRANSDIVMFFCTGHIVFNPWALGPCVLIINHVK